MITQTLIDFLKDERVDLKKKKLYLERLDLQYSDIFKLKEIFEYDRKLYQVLHGLVYYQDSIFYNKISYKNRKMKTNKKQLKSKGRKTNDKHKRK